MSIRLQRLPPIIRNLQYPACKNCVHFIEHTANYPSPYDHIPVDTYYGKCKKFGEMHLVTGHIKYDFAILCRENEKKCGTMGVGYEEKIKTDST
jgi:hypothetical protein